MIRCRDGELAEALKLASLPPDALVFVARLRSLRRVGVGRS